MRPFRAGLLFFAAYVCATAEGPESKARIRGIRDYGKQGSAGIAKITPYLDDADAEVRWEAVKAIAGIGGAESLTPLIKAAGDSESEVQARAAEGLVNFYWPGFLKTGITASFRKAGTAVKGKFTDTNTDVIYPGVEVKPEVIAALARVVSQSKDLHTRAVAARGVGILRGAAALEPLYEALKSKDDGLMYESLIAIQKIRQAESGPRIQFLLKDLNTRVQLAAVETTGLLRNREALGTLKELVGGNGNIKVRRAALAAMAMMPDTASRPLYDTYFQDRDDGLRAGAAEGYARLKQASDVPAIEKAFQEETKMQPRLSMAFALVMLGKRELSEFSPLQYLINTLNSRSYKDVAMPLVTELARDAETRRVIYPVVARGTKDEKMRLAIALAMSGDPEAMPVLESVQRDPDPEVAQEGLRAVRILQNLGASGKRP